MISFADNDSQPLDSVVGPDLPNAAREDSAAEGAGAMFVNAPIHSSRSFDEQPVPDASASDRDERDVRPTRDLLPSGYRALFSRFLQMNRKTQRETAAGLLRGLVLKRKFDVWDFPIVGRGVVISKRHGTRLEAGRFARFMDGCQIAIGTDAGKIPTFRVGRKSSIGSGTKINVGDDFIIGDNTHLAWCVDASSDNFHVIRYDDLSASPRSAPVTIGNNCVVFRNVNINPGVSIGDNCAVGSGANVVNDIPSNVVAVGNPARPLRNIQGIDL